jgi:hypothetical protein
MRYRPGRVRFCHATTFGLDRGKGWEATKIHSDEAERAGRQCNAVQVGAFVMALRAAAGQAFGAGTGPHRASVSLPAEGRHHLVSSQRPRSHQTRSHARHATFSVAGRSRLLESLSIRSPRTRPTSDTHTAAASRWTVKSYGRYCAHACRSAGCPDVQGSLCAGCSPCTARAVGRFRCSTGRRGARASTRVVSACLPCPSITVT